MLRTSSSRVTTEDVNYSCDMKSRIVAYSSHEAPMLRKRLYSGISRMNLSWESWYSRITVRGILLLENKKVNLAISSGEYDIVAGEEERKACSSSLRRKALHLQTGRWVHLYATMSSRLLWKTPVEYEN